MSVAGIDRGAAAALVQRAGLPEAALVAGVLSGFAGAGGGYFPQHWSWASIVFALVAAGALVRGGALRGGGALGGAERVFVGALALLCGWTWLSLLWTADVDATVLEGQRTLLYSLGALALAAVARRAALPAVTGAILAVTGGICVAALAVRLFPERFGVYDPVSENRLAEPLGYWNGLGLVAAIGIVLAVGVVAHVRRPLPRAAAGAIAVLAATTLYFTFSRGAWVALAIGLVVALALPGRLRIAVAAVAVAVPCAVVVALAAQQEALKTRDAVLAQQTLQGHRIALLAVLVALAAAGLAVVAPWLAGRLEELRGAERALSVALAAGAIAAMVAVLVAAGGPVRLVERASDSFSAAPTNPGNDVSKRLASFNGSYRAEMWDVAGGAVAKEPLLGIGAGAYGREWLAERPISYFVKDAHNLYLETLAELGPLGLALLAAALAAPLAVVRRVWRLPFGPVALGGYLAFLVHAAIDWDWELPSVTLAALLLGGALLAAARPAREESPAPSISVTDAGAGSRARPRPTLAGAAALLAIAGLCAFLLGGNAARDDAEDALHHGDAQSALKAARSAEGWQPWSAVPTRLVAEAGAAAGSRAEALRSARQATEDDPGSARAWLVLATLTSGSARDAALAESRRLNPLGDFSDFEEDGE